MPAGDRTGPEGRGPLTGRGRGNCGTPYQKAQAPLPSVNERGMGQGTFGPGRGLGRGPGRGFGYGPGRGLGRGR